MLTGLHSWSVGLTAASNKGRTSRVRATSESSINSQLSPCSTEYNCFQTCRGLRGSSELPALKIRPSVDASRRCCADKRREHGTTTLVRLESGARAELPSRMPTPPCTDGTFEFLDHSDAAGCSYDQIVDACDCHGEPGTQMADARERFHSTRVGHSCTPFLNAALRT